MDERPAVTTFDDVLGDAVARFQSAVANRRHAMRSPVLVTADVDARMMTLRACADDLRVLRFHSDVRCPKVAAIAEDPRVAILAYDPQARVQLRLKGTAVVLDEGDQVDAAWQRTAPMSRRCYLAQAGPGTPLSAPGALLPEDLRGRRPTGVESDGGRGAFAIVLVQVESLDWLHLTAEGGIRALLQRNGSEGGWHGNWIAP